MRFSVQWAGVSIAYVGMARGMVAALRTSSEGPWLPFRVFSAIAGAFFGGGVALPFVASNFVSAYIALWLTRGQGFGHQFVAFMIVALLLGWVTLKWIDQGLGAMGGLHLDRATMLKLLGLAAAAFALSLFLMRFAPTRRAV